MPIREPQIGLRPGLSGGVDAWDDGRAGQILSADFFDITVKTFAVVSAGGVEGVTAKVTYKSSFSDTVAAAETAARNNATPPGTWGFGGWGTNTWGGAANVYSAAITESTRASGSEAAKVVSARSVSDTARASDVPAVGASTFRPAVSDTTRASDAQAVAGSTFTPAVSDTTRASDAQAVAGSTFTPAVSDTARASDAQTARVVFGGALAETARPLDAPAVSASTFRPALSETARTTETYSAAGSTYNTTTSDSARGVDAHSSLPTLRPSVAENARASDAPAVAGSTFTPAVSDTARPSDIAVARATFGGAVSDTARGADNAAATLQAQRNVSETARLLVSYTTVLAVDNSWGNGGWGTGTWGGGNVLWYGAVVESGGATDVVARAATLRSAVAETGQATHSPAVAGSTFTPAVSDTARASDAQAVAGSTFTPAVSDTARASEASASTPTLRSAVADTVTAADAVARAATLRATTTDTARAGDTLGLLSTQYSSITEAGAVSTAVSSILAGEHSWGNGGWGTGTWGGGATAILFGEVLESAQGSVAIARAATLRAATLGNARGADSGLAGYAVGAGLTITARGTDVILPLLAADGSWGNGGWGTGPWGSAVSLWYVVVVDGASVADSLASSGVLPANATEISRTVDTAAGGGAQSIWVTETARALVGYTATLAADGSWGNGGWGTGPWGSAVSLWYGVVVDGVRTADQSIASIVYGPSVAATARGGDSSSARSGNRSAVNEQAAATHARSARLVVRGSIVEQVTVWDLFSANVGFFGEVLDAAFGVEGLDAAAFDIVWGDVNSFQTPGWGAVGDAQSGAWAMVVDAQGGSWQNTGTSPVGSWVDVDDTQPTSWN